ncbi:MAG: hypothetical protein ACKVT0_18925, partial [Planctomycetaceae bacterium]
MAHKTQLQKFLSPRTGTTLTEILMSVLIMSIGVISVATLFPVALLRSVQATHLTHATRFRYNVEALLSLHPQILDSIQVPTQGVQRAVIDPLGFELVPEAAPDPAVTQAFFGNSDTLGIPRRTYTFDYNGDGAIDVTDIEELVTLPDSWVQQSQSAINSATGFNLTLSAGDLSGVTIGQTRVVIFDSTGRNSEIRTVSAVNAGTRTITWTGAALPSGFTPESARIEMRERRYTWMLTVRKSRTGMGREVSHVDAVIFARRPFSHEDETLIPATFTQGDQFVTLGAVPEFLRKGRFVFDINNAV